MSSLEVDLPINVNTLLARIIISKLNAQQILINIFDIQIDPFVNPPNIVIDGIENIVHWS
jgi:hypothetical protein